LTHAGHALFLEDAKKQGDILVVGVGDDVSTAAMKGRGRPVLNQHVRLKIVDSLKPVDYSFACLTPQGHPLSFMEYIFDTLKPDIYVINDDAFDIPFRKELAKKYKMKLIILKRRCPKEFENVSTTKIIEKVKNL